MSPDAPFDVVRFPVAGMTCGSCVNRIRRAVRKIDGVTGVNVDLRRETVTVCRELALVSNAVLAAAVTDAGYEPDLDAAVAVPVADALGLLERLLGRMRAGAGARS